MSQLLRGAWRLCASCLRRSTVPFDPLTATVTEIQSLLASNRITSVELLQSYLEQITQHNAYLRAVIVTGPTALKYASKLDDERGRGVSRGVLHGVPILVKDNIATHPDLGMDTTGGSLALVGAEPFGNAELVQRLIDAGAIILGKANLSELSYYKGVGLMCGWSAVGGQSQSAYTRGDVDLTDSFLGHSSNTTYSPAGSSSGPAISVSAGFCPAAIGTDTGGSIITPATRAALYAMRPTMGLVSQDGIIPVSALADTAGPMARCVRDLAVLMDVLVAPGDIKVEGKYVDALPGSWSNLRVGVLDPKKWFFDAELQTPVKGATEQIIRDTLDAYQKIKNLAKSYHEVDLISPNELLVDGSFSTYDVWDAGFKTSLDDYLAGLNKSKIRSLHELIQFNKDNAAAELPPDYPNQDLLVRAANVSMPKEKYDRLLAHSRSVGREKGIDATLAKYNIDVIIAPADSAFNLLVSAAGYPSATMPLSYLDYNGRPIGLAAFTTAHGEKTLLKVLSAWERSFPGTWKPPPSLVGDVAAIPVKSG